MSELTGPQRAYLAAFDQFLTANTPAQLVEARVAMGERLNFVLAEAGLDLPEDTRWTDMIAAAERLFLADELDEGALDRIQAAARR